MNHLPSAQLCALIYIDNYCTVYIRSEFTPLQYHSTVMASGEGNLLGASWVWIEEERVGGSCGRRGVRISGGEPIRNSK